MNLQFVIKLFITVATVLVATVLAKKSGWLGALVASLPLTSLLVLAWLYNDTRDGARVADLAMGIFWFVLGSLPFFLVLAFALHHGWRMLPACVVAALAGFAGVTMVQWLLTRGST